MKRKISTADAAREDQEFWDSYVESGAFSAEDALIILDCYIEEIETGHPEVFVNRKMLGDACMALLADLEQLENTSRRNFVRRVIGPTTSISLFAILPDVIEYRDWATELLGKREQKQAETKRFQEQWDKDPIF